MGSGLLLLIGALGAGPEPLPGFHRSPWFGEQVREEWIEPDVRMIAIAPGRIDPAKPTRLIIFATPNGNTIEQTLGCGPAQGLDWHFDIQHGAAQVRRFRELTPDNNVILACIEADTLAWPAWRKKHADAPARAARIVDFLRKLAPGTNPKVTLTGHSGGGSFTFAFLDAAESIPDFVERIAFLDSNYSYSDEKKHGDKLLAWLRGGEDRRLSVIAYDDRKITIDGKLVVGPDGGTFRASQRMIARFTKEVDLRELEAGELITQTGMGGRIKFRINKNPANKILHTVLVGEMNGLLAVMFDGSSTSWGTFGGPRAYTQWVQPAPGIPARPAETRGGREFMQSIAKLNRDEREEAIAIELLRGNFPNFLRKFHKVAIPGEGHSADIEVMPDYLGVGSDDDFVRLPMSPVTAQRLADAFGCCLPTRKIVNEFYRAAQVKLEPVPLTEAREAVETFSKHSEMIDKQRFDQVHGELTAGTKKDVVVTNRLAEKQNRVALYGWHMLDGTPIQPLTIVHVNWYVDYSHGVRLMKRQVTVDGKPRDARAVMQSAALHPLLSDEGPILRPSY